MAFNAYTAYLNRKNLLRFMDSDSGVQLVSVKPFNPWPASYGEAIAKASYEVWEEIELSMNDDGEDYQDYTLGNVIYTLLETCPAYALDSST